MFYGLYQKHILQLEQISYGLRIPKNNAAKETAVKETEYVFFVLGFFFCVGLVFKSLVKTRPLNKL